MQRFLILETSANQCRAESQVNGIPLCRLAPTTTLLDSRPVHQFLLRGQNVFTLVVETGPIPSQAIIPSEHPFVPNAKTRASLRLMDMPRGAFPDSLDVRELLRIDWAPTADKPVATPVVLEKTIAIASNRQRWSWLDGGSMAAPEMLHATTAVIAQLRNAFERRDPEPFIAKAQVRFREVSEAYELNLDDEVRKFRDQFKRVSQEADFQMQPLNTAEVDLRVCANGKLVDCVDRSWEPLLRTTKLSNGSTRLRYSIKVASIGGVLQIVR